MKKGSVPFSPSVTVLVLLAIVCAAAAACGDVDVYINTKPPTTLPRAEDPQAAGTDVLSDVSNAGAENPQRIARANGA